MDKGFQIIVVLAGSRIHGINKFNDSIRNYPPLRGKLLEEKSHMFGQMENLFERGLS